MGVTKDLINGQSIPKDAKYLDDDGLQNSLPFLPLFMALRVVIRKY